MTQQWAENKRYFVLKPSETEVSTYNWESMAFSRSRRKLRGTITKQ